MTTPDVFRIGAGSGFAGDRYEPAEILTRHGNLQALVFERLAERTIALAQQERHLSAGTGYDRRLLRRLRTTLPLAAGMRILTNAGAANPVAAFPGRPRPGQGTKPPVLTGSRGIRRRRALLAELS